MKSSIVQLALLAGFSCASTRRQETASSEFDWDSIPPSTDLEYHPCYGEYQCARLRLPLDWHNASDPSTVTIALAKLPAAVPASAPSFRGAVFAQPGGPGVSGTAYLRGNGRKLRDVVDVPGRRHYELVAFDPRGTGHSVPRLDCFPGLLGYLRVQERDMAEAVDASRAALARAVAAGKADGKRCEEEHGEFLRHIGTPNVARDMVAMLDKIEEERQRHGHRKVTDEEESRLELRADPARGDDITRLQYIGISYGTFLGSVFASLFPGRVGRLVLDGVVNPHGYQDGTAPGIDDMDEMVRIFFQGCFDARCPLRRPDDTSGASLGRRFWSWAAALQDAPLVVHTGDGNRRYVSAGTVRQLLILAMYHPLADFRPLAAALDAAMRGDAAALSARVLATAEFTPLPDAVRANFSSSEPPTMPVDAYMGISCADADDVTGRTLDGWLAALDRYRGVSRVAGPWMLGAQTLCAGWTARPAWSFSGPFTTPTPTRPGRAPMPGKPAAPILFLSNRWDPVTPLRDARIARDTFSGAGLVVQDTMGHCATLGAMGPCVRDVVAEYFDTGAVPEEEMTCEATRGVWDS
ncbi:Peptidase S33, tripeptidyl-peptidase [Cordyceps javanica]|uniref:Peptidase S33, tripeptidyl-peptidase n=1 Tax=Cordyceps javanica TaxID=43265 RepID=A0A545W2A4_9HYPO|nr:Peptidase S33, tripeptidyl-peptidase [Cordyceps javanica]TQW08110.1 Peptidase S33, tripeptidyl-peptidase [Cordyceps javanica]